MNNITLMQNLFKTVGVLAVSYTHLSETARNSVNNNLTKTCYRKEGKGREGKG